MRPKLSPEIKIARRRLSYVTPENCGKVLARATYWSTHFLSLYLDRCDETAFHTPVDGYRLAQQAPELAARIRIGDGPGEYRSEGEKRSARVTALAVLAGCCRAAGKMRDAELAIKWAQDLAVDTRLTAKAGCELVRRQAALKLTQGAEDAEDWIQHAVTMAERLGEQPNLADALVLRGVFLAEAERGGVEDVARGMGMADLKDTRGRRTFDAAMFNMSKCAVRSGNRAEAARWIAKVKKQMTRFPRSVNKARVNWMEGLLSAELGSGRYGIRLLEKARRSFVELESVGDFVFCSMDLATIYHLEGEPAQLARVIASTHEGVGAMVEPGVAHGLAAQLAAWQRLGCPPAHHWAERKGVLRVVAEIEGTRMSVGPG